MVPASVRRCGAVGAGVGGPPQAGTVDRWPRPSQQMSPQEPQWDAGKGMYNTCRQGDVVIFSWPIGALVYEPKMRGEGGVNAWPMSSRVRLYTGAQINFGDLTPYLTFACIGHRAQAYICRSGTLHATLIVYWQALWQVVFRLQNVRISPPHTSCLSDAELYILHSPDKRSVE